MDEQFLRNLASTFSGQSLFKHAQSDTHLIWLTVSLYSCPLLKTVTLWLPACHKFRGNLWTLARKITCLHFPQMGATLVSQGHLLLRTGFWEIWQISSSNTTLQGTLMTPHPQSYNQAYIRHNCPYNLLFCIMDLNKQISCNVSKHKLTTSKKSTQQLN